MHYLAPGDTVQGWPRVHMQHAGMLEEAGRDQETGSNRKQDTLESPSYEKLGV